MQVSALDAGKLIVLACATPSMQIGEAQTLFGGAPTNETLDVQISMIFVGSTLRLLTVCPAFFSTGFGDRWSHRLVFGFPFFCSLSLFFF